MNSKEQIELEDKLKTIVIDVNGKGPMVVYARGQFGHQYFDSVMSPISGHAPESAFEMRKAALIGRAHAKQVLEACDNMDRLIDEALKASGT